MSRRTSVSGDLDSKNCRTARRSSSCSSEKAKFTLLCSCSAGLAWEAQHALTDDVVLDLARAGVDSFRATRHEDAGELVELIGARSVLLDQERGPALEAERRHRDLPPFTDGPEHVLLGGARAVEEHFVELRAPGHLAQGPYLYPRLLYRAQEVGEAVVRLRLGIGAAHDEAP